jgi:undecaprenyl-diphosphatase
MTIGSAVLLGVLQGLTEFLPVSSSGHLVLVQSLLPDFEAPGVLFDLFLHLATLGAVLIAFRKDLIRLILGTLGLRTGDRSADLGSLDDLRAARRVTLLLLAGTIPTGLIGVAGEDLFERLFSSPRGVGVGLLLTAAVLFAATLRDRGQGRSMPRIPLLHAVLVGVAQGLAIYPGLSRSGSTIGTGMLLGVEREAAARFSFLLAIPAIAGAVVFKLDEFLLLAGELTAAQVLTWLCGFLAALLSGILAIYWLLALVRRGRLIGFAIYCAILGLAALVLG